MMAGCTTYGVGGYLPDLPDGNVTGQTWQCDCGVCGDGPIPGACPSCGTPPDVEGLVAGEVDGAGGNIIVVGGKQWWKPWSWRS